MFCATKILIGINALMSVLALAGLGYAISIVAQEGAICVGCLAIPVVWGWSLFGLTLCILLISLLAVCAAYKHVKSLLIFMSLFTFVTFAVSTASTVIIMLWATATDLGVLQGTVLALEDQFKSFIARWAVLKQESWIGLQNSLGCCGVDLKAAYSNAQWETLLHTSDIMCKATVDALIRATIVAKPNFSSIPASELSTISDQIKAANGGKAYFCAAKVKQTAAGFAIYLGIILVFLSLLQLVAFGLSMYLLCGVSHEDGGFAEIDEETGKLQSPLRAAANAPSEIASDTRAFANRVSMNVGKGVGPVANRVSTRMGFAPVFTQEYNSMGGPPPGMPPPGFGQPPAGPPPGLANNPVAQSEAMGSGPKDWGEQYAKYMKMKKSGISEGAVRQAMQRDQVPVPDGFFEDDGSAPATATGGANFGGPPPPPPGAGMRGLANRMSFNVKQTTNRMSSKLFGGGGGGFAPPPPPPGFGQLPPDTGAPPSSSPLSIGDPVNNPQFKGAKSNVAIPEEFAPVGAAASKPAKPVKEKPPPKPPREKAPKKKEAPPKKPASPAAGGGGGGAGFLADIAGGGGAPLKKTVTNDRSAPNFNA